MISFRIVLAGLTLAVLAWGAPAEAQYFGRNKVQYQDFDFRVLKTKTFDIYYYPEEEAAVRQAGEMAERWYARLSRQLNHRFARRQPLILYASHPHFQQTNVLQGFIGEGTGGATEVLKRRIVMPLAGSLAETDHVLGHELVHAFQFDMTGEGGVVSAGNIPNAIRLPLWFIEGMAEYLSVGPVDPHTAMWIRDSARREKLPTIEQLDDPKYFPYRFGQALWAYIAGRWGDEAVADALRAAGRRTDAIRILEAVTGRSAKQLSEEWHRAIQEGYRPIFEAKTDARAYGRAIISEKNAGELNVGPALSPDGSQIVFLSEKDLFSIDMYVADAATGRVRRKLVETASDPHYDSLQFITSAGAFDPAGRRFAFAGVRKGRPVITVIDVADGRRLQQVRLSEEIDEAHGPAWSPDGTRVVFSAKVGGYTDLYVLEMASERLTRLTQDAFADLQPAWSPDGRTIAFVSDRFSTNLQTLRSGNYRLAALTPGSNEIRALPGFEEAKNIDPQWSMDGASLFFISDRNGAPNIYRAELASGAITQVTDLVTGVSGITALSPALSVAEGRMVVSVYEEGNHRIYAIEDAERLRGGPLDNAVSRERVATLPPMDRRGGEVLALQADPSFGLPDARTFQTQDYNAKLSLDYIGQPTLTVGADPTRTFVGGGVSFLFSDILGNHTVGTVLQVNGSFEDFGGLVAYENRSNRWIWGAGIEQIPYVSGFVSASAERLPSGEPVVVEEVELFRQTNRTLSVFTAYPFSRSQRLEFSLSGRQIGFSREIRRQVYSQVTGQLLFQGDEDLGAPDDLWFGEAGAALVYDTSIFGATGPILGRRYRLEVAPTFGSIQYAGVLADLRQYFMPVRPFTLAFRGLHYGRYGSGSEDGRIGPLYVGYPNLVRGYDVGSFTFEECPAQGQCEVFDQLLGSKIIVGNAELRFPPFGAIARGRNFYGPIPIDLYFFGDAGVAWGEDRLTRPEFLGGESGRDFVTSVGVGARVNLFGYAVVQIDYVNPIDRPQKGWHWIFNLTPGF